MEIRFRCAVCLSYLEPANPGVHIAERQDMEIELEPCEECLKKAVSDALREERSDT
jgi:hypothetical protein